MLETNPHPALAIVCPMANEITSAQAFVQAVLAECSKSPFKRISFFAILDSVSKDGTRELLDEMARREPRLKVVFAPENRCVVDAYVKGYHCALADNADWILEIDAGFSHHPDDIAHFITAIHDGGVDVIYGTRFALGGKIHDSSLLRTGISKFGGVLANLLLGTRLSDMTSGFILYSRNALESILAHGIQSKGPFFQTEMKFHARHLRFVEVPIVYAGASHHIGAKALLDALFHLCRLVKLRLTPSLWKSDLTP